MKSPSTTKLLLILLLQVVMGNGMQLTRLLKEEVPLITMILFGCVLVIFLIEAVSYLVKLFRYQRWRRHGNILSLGVVLDTAVEYIRKKYPPTKEDVT